MKTSELRIGNFVDINPEYPDIEFEEYIIRQNNPNVKFECFVVEEISKEDVEVYCEKLNIYTELSVKDMIGIELTEEWLIAFGYSIDESNSAGKVFSFIKEVGFVNEDFKIIYFSKTGKFMRRSSEVKYVHQLQNLYFALAGEELVLQD